MSANDPLVAGRSSARGCGCGRHEDVAAHDAEQLTHQVVESALLHALFPQNSTRRSVLAAIGGGTLLAALAEVFPLGAAKALAQSGPTGAIEKKALKIGFIPITCATPIIMAEPMGLYAKHGLDVEVIKTAGWRSSATNRSTRNTTRRTCSRPMPLALTLGAGAAVNPWTTAAIENINGQAITLAMKHKDRRDPKDWKGFRLAVPFDYSMHNYLLRYYVAEAGIDPDKDIQIRAVPPPEMVANLRADNIDGFLGPDPFNQARRL